MKQLSLNALIFSGFLSIGAPFPLSATPTIQIMDQTVLITGPYFRQPYNLNSEIHSIPSEIKNSIFSSHPLAISTPIHSTRAEPMIISAPKITLKSGARISGKSIKIIPTP